MSYKLNYVSVALLALSAILGIRTCRLEEEKSILKRKIEEFCLTKEDKIMTEFIAQNMQKMKNYAPIFIKVAKEKGCLSEIVDSMTVDEKRSFVKYILDSEKDNFITSFYSDLEFVTKKEDYMSKFNKNLLRGD